MSELLAELHQRQQGWPRWGRIAWWVLLMPLAVAAFSAARLRGGSRVAGYVTAAFLALLFITAPFADAQDEPSREVAATSPATSTTTTAERRTTTTTTTTAQPPTATTTTTPSTTTTTVAGEIAAVARIVDGDTLEVAGGKTVRLIGIDTPETVDPRRPVECFGAQASARLADLIPPGSEVRLVQDVEPTDRYGRTLAYVYRASDNLFINEAMVLDGYAIAATYPPNVRHAERFVDFQRQAREANRGLWAACGGADTPLTTTTAPPAAATPPSGGTNCDPAYPDVCIPPPSPDLDCGDIPHRRFRVLPPDPHRFDGRDNDGIGCES